MIFRSIFNSLNHFKFIFYLISTLIGSLIGIYFSLIVFDWFEKNPHAFILPLLFMLFSIRMNRVLQKSDYPAAQNIGTIIGIMVGTGTLIIA